MLNWKTLAVLGVAALNACTTQSRQIGTEHVTDQSNVFKRDATAEVDADAWCATLGSEDADAARSIWEGL